ncbi:peroxidase family protein [Hyphococcus formosus]|uniref:peroxidase family protein n=1 Tax=Hyphococcus formosus TaxID=3143534 RepID=UPI00398B5120
MHKKLRAGAALAVLGLAITVTQQSSAVNLDKDPNRRPAQNITRDTGAEIRARLRDRLGPMAPAFSQGREVRNYDGSGNNKSQPLVGATFQPFQRMTAPDYADGISAMAGQYRKSAREISNLVVAQGDRSVPNPYGTSDFLWQWGQFIDHDLTLGDGVLSEDRSFDIKVPLGDRWFDPANTGDRTIHFDRALFDSATGTDLLNPREQMNELTSWIDGSMIYGNEEERAEALRTHRHGKLRTSAGDLLPFNKDNLPNANGAAPDPTKLFIAGDVRANEQVGLTVMHTLFVREHNRWADIIRNRRPWYSDEDIYQAARRMVIAEIQVITYEEFLPALIGKRAIERYRGYTPGDPTIFTEFSGAAYRLGHTLINPNIMRLNAQGAEIRDGHLALRDAFFNAPDILRKRRDIEPILRGLAAQKSQTFDHMIVDDLRNFLFGPPGAGGFDLAALNIQRGRDRGIGSYNDVREGLGLGRAKTFADVTPDRDLQIALAEAYATVDDIDLWIGGICEPPMDRGGSQLGPTFTHIVARQFAMLRDHDRFWYERDLTRMELAMIRKVTLADIIRANTNIERREIPKNVFYVKR